MVTDSATLTSQQEGPTMSTHEKLLKIFSIENPEEQAIHFAPYEKSGHHLQVREESHRKIIETSTELSSAVIGIAVCADKTTAVLHKQRATLHLYHRDKAHSFLHTRGKHTHSANLCMCKINMLSKGTPACLYPGPGKHWYNATLTNTHTSGIKAP